MKIDLMDVTGQESGIIVYANGDTVICNWASEGAGLPRLFANLFLLALPEDGEIVESGETSELSTLEPERWNIIHDVNNDAPRLAETSSSWRWWRIALDGEDDADVLVIAPNDWA